MRRFALVGSSILVLAAVLAASMLHACANRSAGNGQYTTETTGGRWNDPSVLGRWANAPGPQGSSVGGDPTVLPGDFVNFSAPATRGLARPSDPSKPDLRLLRRAAPAARPAETGGAVPTPVDSRVLVSRANEELWVIQRPGTAVGTAGQADDAPGCGTLVTKLPDGEREVAVPLKHTDVKASIAGYIATVDVTQQFHNPYSGKIEAVYVFPLPDNAAVNEFVMTIGDRHIRGIIREREQAEKIYNEARNQGYAASLLTQERPNIFTQKVANIEPGRSIDINIRYYHTLAYYDSSYEFVFPMVVGPRFNPPGTVGGVGAVPRRQPGTSGQSTEVQYLRPNERSGHDISLSVSIDAGVNIEEVGSRSHVIAVNRPGASRAEVKLSELDSMPNRDFVLRYRVAGEGVKSGMLARKDERGGGYFTLMLVPPADLNSLDRAPVEMVFVIDCSGSMCGRPIEQAKSAAERGLKRLRPGDTFQVIDFAEDASTMGAYPIEANAANVAKGLRYVDTREANGGTMMVRGLRASLDFPHDRERLRVVSFLTDGYIGNEAEILGELHGRLGATRVFSFGVGSCNRYLLERMAKIGKGAVAFLGMNDPAPEVMDLFFDRISHPAMTEIAVDFGGASVKEVFPREIPDLFVGRPVILTGRFEGDVPRNVRVSGKAGGKTVAMNVAVDAGASAAPLAQVWARAKISDLADRMNWEASERLVGQARQVALDYSLMSQWTAFVAVDSLTKTAGDHGTTVAVPVPVPEGVRYETTVPEGGRAAPPPVAGRNSD